MKRILLLLLVLISSVFDAQINLNIGSTNVGSAPVSSFFSYSYVQQIYLKQEINTNAAGNITGLTFYLDPTATITDSSNWTLYLGHTSKSTFTSSTDWIPASQLTQVFAGNVTKNNGKVEVVLTTPFPYNNTDNLVIAAKESAPSIDINNFDEVFRVYPYLPNSTLYYKGDREVIDPASPPGGLRADYKSAITISGLIPNTTPGCPIVLYPANNAQYISLSPNISWQAVSGASSYKVSLGTGTGGTDIINQQVVSTNNLNLSPSIVLNRDTTYYLKVTAVSANGESAGCTENTFKTIPPIPVNDVCTGALVASTFPYSYVQSDAMSSTNNGGFILACANDGMNDGLWFKMIGDGGQYSIKVAPSTLSFDPKIGVFLGTCSNLTCVGTRDNGGGGTAETLVIPTISGTEYFINVGSYEDNVDMPEDVFTITITKL
ncbi:hypothetical protein C1637_18325 [Chryseobacterium lactis]|uniref:Fibronectin type-III domain-containing protein n=1 Tax=Chryseobacterium lactis TaxID=1241981 RepID=A0A3G6RUF1_CHRLC|nr:hypothetical protein [Chryseobacterium lactis]AZA84741.1 hypothetical protein EG342_23835 [Chryseobacterium lactis]AZB05130.1 hypothetical protein EG341_14715 [Chryseobacterium lactis]PNW12112.1 hypothetical protein C1637_18325 [Chryseobacterium lactis]